MQQSYWYMTITVAQKKNIAKNTYMRHNFFATGLKSFSWHCTVTLCQSQWKSLRTSAFFSCAPTDDKPWQTPNPVHTILGLLWSVCMSIMCVCVCVCELPPRLLCLLIRWFILICLIADEETKLCQVPQIPWEVPTSFTKLKKSHFLSWEFFIFIKEIIEEVLEIPPYGTEDVSVAKQRM